MTLPLTPLRLFTVLGLSSLPLALTPCVRAASPPLVDVVTYRYDAAMTGHYPQELVLTPGNVNAASFGKKFAATVDGQVYAQPLYAAGLSIRGRGRHNVVFVCTEHDSVYAFDADTGAKLWQRSFLPFGVDVITTTVPYTDLPGQCQQITPELGITATPALDAATGTLYVEAMTKEVIVPFGKPIYSQQLHALDVRDGMEKAGSPVIVEAAIPGTGDGGTTLTFIPLDYKERPGLLLLNGIVYTSWSSHCDAGSYHGWVIGYNARTLAQVSIYNVTPNGQGASLWEGGAAPAADAAGNLYLNAGNGTFDAQNEDGSRNPAGVDLGESVIRLSTADRHLAAADWFTPFNKDFLNDHDLDTGSAGLVLYDVGSAHLAATAGKEGRIYLLNRDQLGHYTPGADTGAVQTVVTGASGLSGGLFGCPAFFQSAAKGPTLYFAAVGDHAKAFVLDPVTGRINGAATSQTPESFGYPGAVPSISSRAGVDGIAWLLESGNTLHAYAADDLGTELYNTDQAPGLRDQLGPYVKFTTPIIAQGKVYAGTTSQLVAYGLLDPVTPVDVTGRVTVKLRDARATADGVKERAVLINHGTAPLIGPVSLVIDGLGKDFVLANADGTTTQVTPRASFYRNVTLPNGVLPPGGAAHVELTFVSDRHAPPRFSPRVLAGAGVR